MSRWKKNVLLGTVCVIVLLLGLVVYVERLTSGEWQEKKEAVLAAYSQTMLVKADRVDTFVGSETWRIVFGEDKLQKKMIVWIGEESGIHAEYESAGVSMDSVTEKVASADPATRIIRVTPGKLAEELVWEVYYEREQEDGREAGFYDYYRFADGQLLDTYKLGARG
ncbi:DUF5590 domain-containing protein [Paenibacillus sp. YN15]|uniref:cell wall elongation regulator TseB-like domain-containing protein n=1 Tax=Paenibacillus sp. YN15 TaxID=1742774 RepID=UPI000DCBC3C5|nr:DUF5590 domain-containing protein [Paenibacillus sp. YN15]RAU95543.1 hypothetical protein DQG13_21995 [Paenibacillus sp. YN15]